MRKNVHRSEYQKNVFVGALVVLISIFLVLIFMMKYDSKRTPTFQLYAMFRQADGVMIGTPVRYAGIEVGYVSQMELTKKLQARLTLSFFNSIEIPTDSSAAIETNGVLGVKVIDLTPGGNEDNLKENETIMYTQDVIVLDDILNKVLSFMRQKKGVQDEKESN